MNTMIRAAAKRFTRDSARRRRALPALVAVASLCLALPAARASILDFDIVNRTNQPIVALWASPTSSSTWGWAFANTFVADGGGRQPVHFSDSSGGCYYSVRVQFAQGAVRYWDNLNLCAISVMQIYVSNGEVRALVS